MIDCIRDHKRTIAHSDDAAERIGRRVSLIMTMCDARKRQVITHCLSRVLHLAGNWKRDQFPFELARIDPTNRQLPIWYGSKSRIIRIVRIKPDAPAGIFVDALGYKLFQEAWILGVGVCERPYFANGRSQTQVAVWLLTCPHISKGLVLDVNTPQMNDVLAVVSLLRDREKP